MFTSEFNYALPKSFIAQKPTVPRDHCKLMVFDSKKEEISHKKFFELTDLLGENDVLVVNRSQVIPARILFDFKGKTCEIFLLHHLGGGERWKVLVNPGRIFQEGTTFWINDRLSCGVDEVLEDGSRKITFFGDVDAGYELEKEVERAGKIPLPPYISEQIDDVSYYQTVYAYEKGSVAAPTAGLHFTSELIEKLKARGVGFAEVILHIGLGTFQPVRSNNIEDHIMHEEDFELTSGACKILNKALSEKKRIIAVGTTSVRVLESCYDKQKGFIPRTSSTNIFIYPGAYSWKVVDGLITNLHLPKSTLLMLVSSFIESKGFGEPTKKLMELYELAKQEDYRFFSFGDSMFLF